MIFAICFSSDTIESLVQANQEQVKIIEHLNETNQEQNHKMAEFSGRFESAIDAFNNTNQERNNKMGEWLEFAIEAFNNTNTDIDILNNTNKKKMPC